MNKWLSLIILVFGFQAKAGLFVEPFVGYDQSTAKFELVSGLGGGTGSSKSSGMDYGLKFGYSFNGGLWLGLDYTGGSGTTKDDAGIQADSDYSRTAIGALLGYSAGRFNFWFGYGFSDKLTDKAAPSTEYSGTNMKVGAGVALVNHVAINLDYVIPKYTKYTSSGVETDVSSTFAKFDTSGVMLSVSFPFDLTK